LSNNNKQKIIFIKNYDYLNNNNNSDVYNVNNDVNNENILNKDEIYKLFENNLNINAIASNGYVINNINFDNLIKKENSGIYININSLSEENSYLKIMNINLLDRDFEVKDNDINFKDILSDLNNDYVAYTSNGFFKKNIDFDNLVDVPQLYESWIYINLKKIL
jgi:hypothetical protein